MYAIPPYPSIVDPNVQVGPKAASDDHVVAIREMGDMYLQKQGEPAKVGFNEHRREAEDYRAARVVWLPTPDKDPYIKWVYDLMGDRIQEANSYFWQYDVWGFHDSLHYVRYDEKDGKEGGHFAWHQDKNDDWRRPQRKLAGVLYLSDPNEYEGGEFQIMDGGPRTVSAREKGQIVVMPSFVQHRVLPVTKGTRRVLIGWVCGPRFR